MWRVVILYSDLSLPTFTICCYLCRDAIYSLMDNYPFKSLFPFSFLIDVAKKATVFFRTWSDLLADGCEVSVKFVKYLKRWSKVLASWQISPGGTELETVWQGEFQSSSFVWYRRWNLEGPVEYAFSKLTFCVFFFSAAPSDFLWFGSPPYNFLKGGKREGPGFKPPRQNALVTFIRRGWMGCDDFDSRFLLFTTAVSPHAFSCFFFHKSKTI
jgi:hypothetical protein